MNDASTRPQTDLLEGRHVVVLGAAGEVGEGIVRRLLAHAARVTAVSRSAERLDALRTRLASGATPERLALLAADIDSSARNARTREALASLGTVDGVVASLGGWRQGAPVVDTPPERWHEAIEQSLTAHYHAARLFLPLLAARSDASYVLVNGGGALQPVPGAGAMCVSAAAQLMLKDVLALEHRRSNVRINTLLLATPVRTRSRPAGMPGWLTAADAGEWASYLVSARSPHRGETIVVGDEQQSSRLPAPFGEAGGT
jgi:NAD(P)-dependent dehydrogenase (short-subunit alcohol dehydrogenase family)